MNDAAVELFGYETRDELMKVNVPDLYANPEERRMHVQTIEQQGFLKEYPVNLRRKDGGIINTLITSAARTDEEGTVIGFQGTIRDIKEREQAEKERERLLKDLAAKNRELERFTSTVSHDLRSPLVTVKGFISMRQIDLEQNEREKAETDLKYISNAATQMDKLLSDTLQLSRIGRVANPPEDVPFGEIVQGALEQTAEQIKSSGAEISVAEALPTVHVDRMRIAEVLVNLIGNSIKYMSESASPKIVIGHYITGKEAILFVKDNGIGIDEIQHEKVFELFYKVDKNSKGTGAGLAIVKRIIEVHEGHLWIESEKGKGTTVCFTRPVV
jgi:PAS domain S-box-containing protein